MNTNKFKLVLVSAITAAIAISGCRKGFDDFGNTNINPNTTTVPVTAALLTNTLANIGGFAWGNTLNIAGGLYAQYFSETQYTDQSRYAPPTLNWDDYYAGPLYDLQNIIDVNTDESTREIAANYGSNNNQIAIARILKAYHFMQLTDAFGDLPYAAALQGEGVLPYESQDEIYPDLLNELREANEQFDNGALVQGDILFFGNVEQWKKFSNSLRAIMALRISNANEQLGRTEFADAVASGVMETNDDNATINYPGGNYINPIYNYYYQTQRFDYAVSETIINKLEELNDPRIAVFGTTDVGFPYGLSRDEAIAFSTANPNWSMILSEEWASETSPLSILTAGQIYLARAEGAQRGWTSENVAEMYNTGIRLCMARWNIPAGAITTYLAQPEVALTAGSELEKIGEQRWLSHYPDGTQGWAEWRRTGYPVLTPAPGATQIPRRLPYGPNESLYNPENYAAGAARYTAGGQPNSIFGRNWWDTP